MNKPYILCLIDDDDIYRFTFTKLINTKKIAGKVLVFEDGDQALQFMLDNVGNSKDLPDFIFLDINMPIMDGFQFMEEYVKLKPKVGKKITIYMVTSSVDPVDLERAQKIEEISDYIVKPITPELLESILEGIHKEV